MNEQEKILHSGADPQDYAQNQNNGSGGIMPFLRGAQGLPIEAIPYEDEPISTYETRHNMPFLADRLGISDKLTVDPVFEMKIRAVDEFVLQTMQERRSTDSKAGFNAILTEMSGKLGDTFESARNHGNLKELVDTLFMQVAIANRLSSKTYLDRFTKGYNERKVQSKLKSLKENLSKL